MPAADIADTAAVASRILLRATGIDAGYGAHRRGPHVVHDVNLTVTAGRTIGVVGESGSGKSTLARVLAGDRKPVPRKRSHIEISVDGFHRQGDVLTQQHHNRETARCGSVSSPSLTPSVRCAPESWTRCSRGCPSASPISPLAPSCSPNPS
jgi:ABC-type glutathione transport system ATPase component